MSRAQEWRIAGGALASVAPSPAPAAPVASDTPGATAGPEPADLVGSIYRSAMQGPMFSTSAPARNICRASLFA